MDNKKVLKVVVCHIDEDEQFLQTLFRALTAERNWLSYWKPEHMLPGDVIEQVIQKKVFDCNIFLVCCSKRALTEQGWFHFYLRTAFRSLRMRPESSRYILPVCLDDSELPESLLDYYSAKIDIFPEQGIRKIITTMKEEAEKRNIIISTPDLPTIEPARKSGEARDITVASRDITRLQKIIRQFLTRYDFNGALVFLNSDYFANLLSSKQNFKLQNLLNHAIYRQLFKLKVAEGLLIDCDLEAQPGLRGYYPLPDTATSTDLHKEELWFGAGAVSELYWHCDLLWETAHFSDYLARLKTLTDRLAIFMLEIITEIPFSYEEAAYNASCLDGTAAGFSKLGGGLNSVFEPYLAYLKDDGSLKKVGFGKETDTAQAVIEVILNSNVNINDANVVKRRVTHLTTTINLQPFLTKTNLVTALDNLAKLIFYEENSGKYIKGSLAVYNLTKLRNSLPPAHSFGSIDTSIIYAATAVNDPTNWPPNTPPHQVIGKALTELWDELKKTPTWKDCPVQFSAEHEKSPFKEINRQIEKLLNEIRKNRE